MAGSSNARAGRGGGAEEDVGRRRVAARRKRRREREGVAETERHATCCGPRLRCWESNRRPPRRASPFIYSTRADITGPGHSGHRLCCWRMRQTNGRTNARYAATAGHRSGPQRNAQARAQARPQATHKHARASAIGQYPPRPQQGHRTSASATHNGLPQLPRTSFQQYNGFSQTEIRIPVAHGVTYSSYSRAVVVVQEHARRRQQHSGNFGRIHPVATLSRALPASARERKP